MTFLCIFHRFTNALRRLRYLIVELKNDGASHLHRIWKGVTVYQEWASVILTPKSLNQLHLKWSPRAKQFKW